MYYVAIASDQWDKFTSAFSSLGKVLSQLILLKTAIYGVFIALCVIIIIEVLKGLWIASR